CEHAPLAAGCSFKKTENDFRRGAVRKMHLARCQHRALFPKHLLVCAGDPLHVCIIDLEKSRLRLSVHQCAVHDLDTLNRHAHGFSLSDRMRFFKHYLNVSKLGAREKFLWRWIARRGVPNKAISG
ncbi:MAG: lipopolysaccharide kinase InaA family protein, partial [Burkholderiales bacterium]